MNYMTREYIRTEVNRAVTDRLTPGFFDIMFQEMRFKNLTNDAVSKYLPSEVARQLSHSSSIVGVHVNAQVKPLVTEAMSTQFANLRTQFDEKLNEQRLRFQSI